MLYYALCGTNRWSLTFINHLEVHIELQPLGNERGWEIYSDFNVIKVKGSCRQVAKAAKIWK